MSSTSQHPQDQRPANLVALHAALEEIAAKTKPASEKPVIVQGPVLVVRGK